MTDSKRRIEYVGLDALTVDPANPKAHDETLVGSSIGRFGFVDPIVRDERTGFIVSGHGRRSALRNMRDAGETPPEGVVAEGGDWLVPVMVGWASRSDSEAHAALVALNKSSEVGGWDDDALLAVLEELADADPENGLEGLGFDDDGLEALRETVEKIGDEDPGNPWDDRTVKPMPEATTVEFGDVYRVGRHIIACGRSDDPEFVSRVFDGRKASMVFSDPPYGIEYSGGGVERAAIQGDTPDEAVELLEKTMLIAGEHVIAGATSYVTLPSGPVFPLLAMVLYEQELYRWTIVWAKNNATFGRSDYHQQHEMIVYGWWPTGGHKQVANRSETTLWEIDRPSRSGTHPTEKPIELVARATRNSTDIGDIVYDPFGGSFATVRAAEQEGRSGVSIELEPGYVQVALEVVSGLTGEAPVKIDLEKEQNEDNKRIS